MRNLVDYFSENVNVSFEELPFNELDAAIFSRLSYIDFDKFVSPYKYQMRIFWNSHTTTKPQKPRGRNDSK